MRRYLGGDVYKRQQLRRYTREIDPGAFITIVDSSEIVGKGFRGTN